VPLGFKADAKNKYWGECISSKGFQSGIRWS
jgi:hypothetical protein